jgi:two-component system NtrC family sensor kinase
LRKPRTRKRPSRPKAPALDPLVLGDLLDLMGDCVLLEDSGGIIRFANRAAERILGYSPGELIGKAESLLEPIAQGSVSGPAATGRSIRRVRRRDGREIQLAVETTPARGGEGRVHLLRDVTAEAHLKDRLVQSEKMSAVGQLVSGVAHDLNNPLTSIVGYAQLLKARNAEPRMRRGLEVIGDEAMRASKIVQNLLTFARKHSPEKQHLGLNGIIQKTLELKSYDFRVKCIEIATDLQPDLPYTMLDFHQIQQVMINLLTNAEQAIAGGRPGGMIRISTRRVDPSIVVTLEDDGPGLPAGAETRVFDPFFTTKPAGVGTGLGLSICHGIIAEHGGSIQAENRAEGGARIVIELPISGPQAGEDTPAHGPARAESVPAGARHSILIVDDEAAIQDVLVAMLTMEGHQVDTASSGETALRKIQNRRYDLIVSDLRMPGISGMELFDRVGREHPAVAERIVFMTGDLVNEESSRFLQRVQNLCLPKPFTLDSLRDTLRRFAERFPASSN